MSPSYLGIAITFDGHTYLTCVWGFTTHCETNAIYEVRKLELVPYYEVACKLMAMFEHIQLGHVPQSENTLVNDLAKLAVALAFLVGTQK